MFNIFFERTQQKHVRIFHFFVKISLQFNFGIFCPCRAAGFTCWNLMALRSCHCVIPPLSFRGRRHTIALTILSSPLFLSFTRRRSSSSSCPSSWSASAFLVASRPVPAAKSLANKGKRCPAWNQISLNFILGPTRGAVERRFKLF